MWEESVGPRLATLLGESRQLIGHKTLHCFGAGESDVESMLPDLIRRGRDPVVGITAAQGAVIDGAIAWTGSQNIVEAGYGHRRAGVWHDIMARLTGPAVTQLQTVFWEDWYHETGEQPGTYLLTPSSDACV